IKSKASIAAAALTIGGMAAGCERSNHESPKKAPSSAERALKMDEISGEVSDKSDFVLKKSGKADSPSAPKPSWDEGSCEELFAGEFNSIWAAKAYKRADGSTYALMHGKNTEDIYKSVLTAGEWGTPSLVDGINTSIADIDMVVLGNKIYTITAGTGNNNIRVCDWDENDLEGSNCATLQPSDSARSLNHHDGFMYYSGGYGSFARRFDMGVNPWTTEETGPDGISDTYGVYLNKDFGIISVGCWDSLGAPYACEPEKSRLIRYDMPGWTNPTILPFDQASKLASPFVAPDGSLWFTATPNISPEQRSLYSCAPNPNDGYCGGSADSEGDCCPTEECVGQGCGTHPACQPCVPEFTECAVDQECGTIDNGCGTEIPCGTCAPASADICDDDYIVKFQTACVGNTCIESVSDTIPCEYGCEDATCQDCEPVTTECAPEQECGTIIDECGGEIDCGTCPPPSADTCEGSAIIQFEIACVGNSCEETIKNTIPCENGCEDAQCKLPPDPCTPDHPEITNPTAGCELECLDTDPPAILIANKPGQTCELEIDVKKDGTLPAQIDLQGNATCTQGVLECADDGCVIGCGDAEVLDNGQGLSTKPSGESVITGIVGTWYKIQRFLYESGASVLKVDIKEGCLWYKFPGYEKIYLAKIVEDCGGETDEVFDGLKSENDNGNYAVETVGGVVNPEVVEGAEIVEEADVVEGEEVIEQGDFEVIEGEEIIEQDIEKDFGNDFEQGDDFTQGDDLEQGDDFAQGDDSEQGDDMKIPHETAGPDTDKNDSIDSDIQAPPKKGGGCTSSPETSSNGNGVLLLIAGIGLAITRALRRKRKVEA
ncbi:MAG: hypothetical protein PHP74_01165, partial [Candidatus Gracilibacteria bacterium]|nr:hypothetical protein [Candidatus Gracilibacteria bacterium]